MWLYIYMSVCVCITYMYKSVQEKSNHCEYNENGLHDLESI